MTLPLINQILFFGTLLGLILFFITFVVLSLSKLLLMQMRRKEGTRT